MKTVLIDNSLCALSIRDDAQADDIARYICALAETGVRYVEIDFRALMKLRHLPEGIGYIFRPVDPMFLRFTEVFRFDYIALSVPEVTRYTSIDIPVMFSLPLPGKSYMSKSPRDIIRCAEDITGGTVTSVRIRGDFPLIRTADAEKYIDFLKKRVAIPVDICATNKYKTALNTAINFLNCNADSVTVTMGSSEKYCSLEELVIAFVTMFGGCPNGLSMAGLCKAAAFHTQVFNSSIENDIPELVRVFENDLRFLQNADTGERVFSAKPQRHKQSRFTQSFADFLKAIKIDPGIEDDPVLEEAADSYSASLYNSCDDNGIRKKQFGKNPPFVN